MNTLADALPAKIREMNEVIIPAYVGIISEVPMAAMTVAIMRQDVHRAVESLASGDVVLMLHAYAAIKDYDV